MLERSTLRLAVLALGLFGAGWALPAAAQPIDEQSLTAQGEYAASYVWFEDWGRTELAAGRGARPEALQGSEGVALRPDEFYELVGRPDFAEQYRRRKTAREALTITYDVGFAATSVFLAIGLSQGSQQVSRTNEFDVETGRFEDRSKCFTCGNWALWAATGTFSLSVGTAIARSLIRLSPTSPAESRQLARVYNESLARRLGVKPPPNVRLHLAPTGAMATFSF